MTVAVVALSLLSAVLAGVIVALLSERSRTRPGTAVAAPDEPDVLPDRLVAALDSLTMGVVVADADDSVRFRNRAALAILESRDSRSIVERAVRDLLVAAVRGEPGEREIDLFGPPQATYLIRAVPLAAPVDGSAPTTVGPGSVAVIEDITERRRTDQVRRDFVSNISHELKTPVGALALLADTMRDETDLGTIERFAERMSTEVARVSRTIDDLLELSAIEFGDDLFIDDGPIGPMIDDALSRYRSVAEARGIELVASGDLDAVVCADRRQITSAVSNLVDNAVKYSPDGATVEAAVVAADGSVAIAVTDDGDGIPSRDLGRVFERFYRVDRARSRDTGGTGLGLAIVRHVAQNHGGEVAVRSKEGHGSTFTLRLPVDGPAARLADDTPPEADP